jgi:16S rRNA (uracil1498-N3)-methyltransferase
MDVRDARTRLIVPALPGPGASLRLSPEETSHARARRLSVGQSVVLLDGSGREARATVVRSSKGEAIVEVEEVSRAARPDPPICLVTCGLRAERLAWLVEKGTELGISRVVLVVSDRTQSFRASPRALPRLESVARSAAKQSRRADWPTFSGPMALSRALEEEEAAHRLFLDFAGDPFPRRLAPGASALVVGPEGGWTDSERNEAAGRGWKRVTLPAGSLRAETAALASIVLLRAAFEAAR